MRVGAPGHANHSAGMSRISTIEWDYVSGIVEHLALRNFSGVSSVSFQASSRCGESVCCPAMLVSLICTLSAQFGDSKILIQVEFGRLAVLSCGASLVYT